MKSSSTVTALVLQMEAVKKSQDEMRVIVMELMKEMIQISQAQAESNLRFVRLIENHTDFMRAFTKTGPGSSRPYTEEAEAQTWRAELNEARTSPTEP
jgi:hypothetical protein